MLSALLRRTIGWRRRSRRTKKSQRAGPLENPSHSSSTKPLPILHANALRPKTSLLRLPPELRNAIYRYTLLQDNSITVDSGNHEQPGILRACRILRNEAESIFRYESTFLIPLQDLRMRVPEAHWMARYQRHGGVRCQFQVVGLANWSNFLSWLQKRYHHREPRISIAPKDSSVPGRHHVLVQALAIVDEMRDCPWAMVVKVLERFKAAVALMGFEWS